MANEVKHPRNNIVDADGNLKPLENDYRNKPGRWGGPDVTKRPPALTAAQLDEIRAKAPKPQPTFAQRMEEAKRTGVAVKPSVVVIGKNGTEKLQ